MLWDTLLWNPALKVSPCVARLWEWGDYVRVTQTTKLGARERGREWRALVGAGTHQTSWKSSFSCAIPQKSEINCRKDNQQRSEIFCCILLISFQHLLWFVTFVVWTACFVCKCVICEWGCVCRGNTTPVVCQSVFFTCARRDFATHGSGDACANLQFNHRKVVVITFTTFFLIGGLREATKKMVKFRKFP